MATLGSQTVGSIVKLNVNGVATNFIVVHQGLPGSMYDSSCEGTWLLMQDLYVESAWDSTYKLNDYAASVIHEYLNNTFINLFDNEIKSVIQQVKIPYTKVDLATGSVVTGSNGLSTKVFLLSAAEVGYSGYGANVEGTVTSYFNGAGNSNSAIRIAYRNGTADTWWLRTPYGAKGSDTGKGGYINARGDYAGYSVGAKRWIRPALILPGELSVESDGSVTLATGAITGSVNIGGVQRELTGKGYINIGGVLRELSDSQVNIGGILKSLKG